MTHKSCFMRHKKYCLFTRQKLIQLLSYTNNTSKQLEADCETNPHFQTPNRTQTDKQRRLSATTLVPLVCVSLLNDFVQIFLQKRVSHQSSVFSCNFQRKKHFLLRMSHIIKVVLVLLIIAFEKFWVMQL